MVPKASDTAQGSQRSLAGLLSIARQEGFTMLIRICTLVGIVQIESSGRSRGVPVEQGHTCVSIDAHMLAQKCMHLCLLMWLPGMLKYTIEQIL